MPAKTLNFKSGYFSTTWKNNCVAVGLAAGFVEPLEATSISTTIQQARLICSYLPTFSYKRTYGIKEYHRVMDSIMENILCMISLHYISDRNDTPMWAEQQKAEKPPLLMHLLELWNTRCPEHHDIPSTGFELFGPAHLWHVAQGQEYSIKKLHQYNWKHTILVNLLERIFHKYHRNSLTRNWWTMLKHSEKLQIVKPEIFHDLPKLKKNQVLLSCVDPNLMDDSCRPYTNNGNWPEWWKELSGSEGGLKRCSGTSDYLSTGFTIPSGQS